MFDAFYVKNVGNSNILFSTYCWLLPFILVKFLTNNSLHTFETSRRCSVDILGFRADRYLVDSMKTCYFIDYRFVQSIWLTISSSYCCQNQFLSKVISHFKSFWFDTLILQNGFCIRAVVSRINTSTLKGNLLDFIHVECVSDKRWTSSTPPFVGSYTVCMLGF